MQSTRETEFVVDTYELGVPHSLSSACLRNNLDPRILFDVNATVPSTFERQEDSRLSARISAFWVPQIPWIPISDDLCIMSDLAVGQTIQLTDNRVAIVRYIGKPLFAQGEWVGVELEDGSGKNDGSVQGERYFECEMGKGMFLRPTAVAAILEQPAPIPKATNGPVKKPARPSSVVGSGVGRRMSSLPDTGAGKRMSMNAASPSPATRSRPSSMLRVGLISFV